MSSNNPNQNRYQREYEQGKSHIKEEGYTQVEKRQDGGTVTKTFESKTVTTKYGDDGKVITTTEGGDQWKSGQG